MVRSECRCAFGQPKMQILEHALPLLQIEGLPTMVFVSPDQAKPAIRTEGLLPADTIIKIITDELTSLPSVEIPPEPAQS